MLQCCRCCCCCSWCVFFSPLFFSVLLCSGLLSPFKQSGKWKWKASGVCARPFFPTTIFVPRYIKATHITQWKITPTHKNNIHLANALKATTAKTKIFRSFVRLFIRTLCSPFSKCNVNGSKQRKKNHQQRRERERERANKKEKPTLALVTQWSKSMNISIYCLSRENIPHIFPFQQFVIYMNCNERSAQFRSRTFTLIYWNNKMKWLVSNWCGNLFLTMF